MAICNEINNEEFIKEREAIDKYVIFHLRGASGNRIAEVKGNVLAYMDTNDWRKKSRAVKKRIKKMLEENRAERTAGHQYYAHVRNGPKEIVRCPVFLAYFTWLESFYCYFEEDLSWNEKVHKRNCAAFDELYGLVEASNFNVKKGIIFMYDKYRELLTARIRDLKKAKWTERNEVVLEIFNEKIEKLTMALKK